MAQPVLTFPSRGTTLDQDAPTRSGVQDKVERRERILLVMAELHNSTSEQAPRAERVDGSGKSQMAVPSPSSKALGGYDHCENSTTLPPGHSPVIRLTMVPQGSTTHILKLCPQPPEDTLNLIQYAPCIPLH